MKNKCIVYKVQDYDNTPLHVRVDMETVIRRGMCHRMVVGYTTTCVTSVYHHLSYEFEPRS
jgi:hypothetical protein